MSTTAEPAVRVLTDAVVTTEDAATFLYDEAELLEANELEAWLALFEPGVGRYQIPTTDAPPDARPEEVQFFIADDWELLNARIVRLLSRGAHAENPRSLTHRMITNVRVEALGEGVFRIRAKFFVNRMRDNRIDPYIGRYEHTVVATDAGLRFRLRRTWLATEMVQPGGRLSFIL